MKNKKELIDEANKIAKEHSFKKSVIETMLNDLDGKKTFSEEHINGMAIIEDILKEMDELQIKHDQIREQIKNS